jgi:hypothetical protein
MNILTTFMLAASDAPRPPSVGSVILSDVAGGNRFTSTAFPVTVTMADDGNPLSTKGMKAYVQGDLTTYAQTSTITSASTTGADLTQFSNWSSVPFNASYIQTVMRPVANNQWVMFRQWRSGNSGEYEQNAQWHRLNAANPLNTTGPSDWAQQSSFWVGGRQARGFIDAGPTWLAIRSDAVDGSGQTTGTVRLETSTGGTVWSGGRSNQNFSVGCQAHAGTNYLVYKSILNNSTSNTYWRRLTNGTNQVTMTTNEYVSFGGGNAQDKSGPGLYRLENNEYYLDNGIGEILQGSSTSFQTLASLGRSRPSIPSYTIYQKNNEIYFVYNNVAYITRDMITYRTQPFYQTPSSGHMWQSWGSWQGWGWTAQSRRNDGLYTNWVSLDDCQTWFAPTGAVNASEYIYYRSEGNGVMYEDAPCHWRQSYSGYQAPRPMASLNLTDSTNVSNFEVGEPVSEVNSNGSTGDGRGMLFSTSGSNIKVQYSTGTFDTGSSVKTENKVIEDATLYCTLNSSGVVSNLTSSDPGFVTQTATPTQVSFPGTFSSGNAPDADLPAGTTLTVQVNATNIEGTDSATSNTITPS